MEANSAHNLVSKEAYSTTKFLTYLIMVSVQSGVCEAKNTFVTINQGKLHTSATCPFQIYEHR